MSGATVGSNAPPVVWCMRFDVRSSNATVESAHRYGTTFDISYVRFVCCDSSYVVAPQDLRGILAEVLDYYRKENRCLVKYEVKQGCFHITAR